MHSRCQKWQWSTSSNKIQVEGQPRAEATRKVLDGNYCILKRLNFSWCSAGDERSSLTSLCSAGEGEGKAADPASSAFAFTLRAKTSLSQRLLSGLEGKMKLYLQKLQKERKNGRFPFALIENMDETPVYFDFVPVNWVGVKSCVIHSTDAEKRHITVVLNATAHGHLQEEMSSEAYSTWRSSHLCADRSRPGWMKTWWKSNLNASGSHTLRRQLRD